MLFRKSGPKPPNKGLKTKVSGTTISLFDFGQLSNARRMFSASKKALQNPCVFKRFLKVFLPVLVLAAAIYATVLMKQMRPPPETRLVEPPIPVVLTMEARYSNVPLSVFADGTVAPRTESELIPEVSGRVIEISPLLAVGGFFEKGEVLLRLDPREYELALTGARAAIAQSKLRLEVERQEAAVAIDEWELLGSGRPASLVLREPQIAEAQAALASAEAAFQQAEYNLERTVVRAPYAGRIRQEQVDVGQFVSRGNSVATIYAIDAAEIRLPIADSELAFLDLPLAYRDNASAGSARGPTVVLKADFAGGQHQWVGTIVRTAGEIDPRTRMIHVIARVEDPYGRGNDASRPPLAVGMFVEAEIQGRSSGRVVVVPRGVLQGTDEVLIVDDTGHLQFKKVELFRLERDRVLIKSGIEEGDRIITSPLENAFSGMKVRVQEQHEGKDPV